jgi:hypothetical protein
LVAPPVLSVSIETPVAKTIADTLRKSTAPPPFTRTTPFKVS